MTAQRIILKIGAITLNAPTSRWRLEAALSKELHTLLASPNLASQLGQSKNIETRITSFNHSDQPQEAVLGAKIATSVMGVLKS